MRQPRALIGHGYLSQVCFVAIASTACVLVTDALGFRSPVNLAWMIGLPIATGIVSNVGWDRRCFMAMALLAVSLVFATIVGVTFTSYG